MTSFQITDSQAQALIGALQDHADGEPILITPQGDGSLTLGFNLATITIDTSGQTEEN